MDDLVAFLRSRLDEDAVIARAADAAIGGNAEADVPLIVHDNAHEAVAIHISRHDPARVLAEVDAKRLLLAEYADVVGNESADYEWAGGWANGLGKAVALLALPYADHPDYLDTWRP
ncbi:DUF6221 family protein [Streptomyces sp. NPDC091368]|uniref:DUF6221 family protein n=1 Tax=Streptomyces sp. NPDC091368 TaxID=3365993 RepID=UPI0037F74E09